MNPLKPLLFLTFRTTINGLKRAVTSPTRVLYVLFFFGYYAFLINRTALVVGGATHVGVPSSMRGRLNFPPLEAVDALAFALFSLGWIIMLVALTANQNTMKPADVDVLFPTPISPKVVLTFRIVRDYFFTLITPLVIALLGMRASKMGWEALFRNMPHPEYSGLAIRAMSVSWILMALCFVVIIHATALYINRSDRNGDRYRAAISWFVGIFLFGFVGFLVYWFDVHPGLRSAIDLANSPILRAVFVLPTFACELTMAPFRADLRSGLLGAFGLVAVIVLGLRIAFCQISWFYDECAVKGFFVENQRTMQRAGDLAGIVAERARTGRFRIRRWRWLYNRNLSGSWALVWKELIIQPRTLLAFIVIMLVMEVGLSVLSATMSFQGRSQQGPGIMLLSLQGSMTFMISTIAGQSGFNEVLRRVDLEKALPFTSSELVWKEVMARSILGAAGCWLGVIGFLVVSPQSWQFAVAAAISTPAANLLLMSAMFLVTVLFPDMEDTTQRQFRGLVMLVAFAVTGFVPLAVFVAMMVASYPAVLCSIVAAILCLLILALVNLISGRIYAGFNASE